MCREQVASMANGERALQETLVVNINHVKWYDNDLAEQIEIEWLRLEPRLRQAVQRLVREVAPEFVKGDDQNEREFYIAWEGFNNVERLRDLRSAKVRVGLTIQTCQDSSSWFLSQTALRASTSTSLQQTPH